MDDRHLFDELLRAAEQLGVAVRMEPFETPATAGGGLCVLRGERLILLDAKAPLGDRTLTLARSLSGTRDRHDLHGPGGKHHLDNRPAEA